MVGLFVESTDPDTLRGFRHYRDSSNKICLNLCILILHIFSATVVDKMAFLFNFVSNF